MGNALDLLTEQPHVALAEYTREFGDLLVWWRFDKPKGLVNDPRLIERILVEDKDLWIKDSPVDELRPVVRSSVFIANPPEWAPKRRGHPFEQNVLETWKAEAFPMVFSRFRSVFRKAAQSGEFELFELVHRACFDLLADVVLDEPLTDRDYEDYKIMLAEGARRLKVGPISVAPHFEIARRRWWERITSLVEERAKHPDPAGTGVLARLLRAGSPLTGDRLVDEIGTIFLAGAGPIATTIAVAAWNMAKHPHHADHLGAALREQEAAQNAWTWATLDAFEPLDRFLAESLRIIPTVPVITRAVKPGATARLRDVTLEEGDEVFIVQWALHRTKKWWPEPMKFDPSRFATIPDPFVYMPFGAGERRCVGRPVALYVAKSALAALARRWRPEIDTSEAFPTRMYTGFMIPGERIPTRLIEAG